MNTNRPVIFLLSILSLSAAAASADEDSQNILAPADQKRHAELVKQLSPDQSKVLAAAYPGFRILKLCPGRFSGADRDELVLGIWKPVEPAESQDGEVFRVGLVWSGKAWQVHNIDDELVEDQDISHSFPMTWQYKFTEDGFSGDMKCGIASEFKDNSDLTYAMGDKPFFDLKKKGLAKNKPVCFATDDVYNNWDCVVYSPADGRFRLWFQQAHAD